MFNTLQRNFSLRLKEYQSIFRNYKLFQTMNLSQSSSFLEVTINSEKLSSFLLRVEDIIKGQSQKIEDLNSKFLFMSQKLGEKMQKIEHDFSFSDKEMRRAITNEALNQKALISKVQSKIESQRNDFEDKFSRVNLKLLQSKERVSTIENKSDFAYEECKEIKYLKEKVTVLDTSLENFKVETQQKIQEYFMGSHDDKVEDQCKEVFFKILQNDRVRSLLANDRPLNSIEKEMGIRRRPKTLHPRAIEQKQALFFASVSDKLNALQKRLAERGNEVLNKVMYPQDWEQKKMAEEELRLSKLQEFKNQEKINHHTLNIMERLEKIEGLIAKISEQGSKDLKAEIDRREVLTDKFNILTKKHEKNQNTLNELKTDLRKYMERKFDESMIDSFRFEIRQLSLSYEDTLSRKVNREAYEQEVRKIYEKLRVDSKSIGEKAEKAEVKKAISFIEEKIKDIILLVAGSFEDGTNGAIQKKPITCLSCDKDIESKLKVLKEAMSGSKENNFVSTSNTDRATEGLTRADSSLKLRSTTSRMRRHIRLTSGSSTPKVFQRTGGSGLVSPINLD